MGLFVDREVGYCDGKPACAVAMPPVCPYVQWQGRALVKALMKMQALANAMVRLTAHAHAETKLKPCTTVSAIVRPPFYTKAMPTSCAPARAIVRS